MDPQASHRRNVLFWLQLLLASLDEEVYRAIPGDRKSTRLNSSHGYISYAVFCLKKKIVHTHDPQVVGALHHLWVAATSAIVEQLVAPTHALPRTAPQARQRRDACPGQPQLPVAR